MRYQDIKPVEEIRLDEINMSPSSLRRLAGAVDARAGMEFEMIVPEIGDLGDDFDPDDFDPEPDYDYDDSVSDILDAVRFFDDRAHNDVQTIRRLEQSMREDYESYVMEQFDEYWYENSHELVREYLTLNASDSEIAEILELDDEQTQELEDRGSSKAEYTAAADRVIEDQDSSAWYDDAREAAEQDYLRDSDHEEEWLLANGMETYRDVMSNYAQRDIVYVNWPYWTEADEEGGGPSTEYQELALNFMRAIGDTSIAISPEYKGNYWQYEGNNWTRIGDSKPDDCYAIEPDGSVKAANRAIVASNGKVLQKFYVDPREHETKIAQNEKAYMNKWLSQNLGKSPAPAGTSYSVKPIRQQGQGLEFVSPPKPVSELLADLNKIKSWATKNGVTTNASSGLHINVSVPNFESRQDLDYVKLALLLGDEYVLDQFGRSANSYCSAAIKKVQQMIADNPAGVSKVLDTMRSGLKTLASKSIHSGETSKYTSINTKNGYIEFRSPGGDWLDENFDKIDNTLMRFIVALDAATDESKYKQDYAKKLYKLLAPQGQQDPYSDMLEEFSRYMAATGGFDSGKPLRAGDPESEKILGPMRDFRKSALELARQSTLTTKVRKNKLVGEYWWHVGLKSNPNYKIEVVGNSADEAIDAAMDANEELMRYNRNTDFTARPVRPYDGSPVKAGAGKPEANGQRYRQPAGGSRNALSQTDIENRLGWPDQTGDANYEVVERRTQRPVFKFVANTYQDALRKYSQYLDVMGMPEDTEDYGFREIALPGSTIDLQRQRAAHNRVAVDDLFGEFNDEGPGQQYKIIRMSDRSLLTVVRASNQQEAESKAAQIFLDHGLDPDLYDVFPSRPQQQQPAPRPLSAGRELVGWSVRLPNGREVTQIRGIGNNQGDANRIAADWLRQNGMGVSGEGFEVVPVWGEA